MAKFVPRAFEDILQRMINKVVARSNLSDLEETSSVKWVLSAIAREMDDAYFQMSNLLKTFSITTAEGSDLDERAADYNPEIIARLPAVAATGTVIFSRVTAGGAVTVPAGVRVEVPGAVPPIVVITTASGSIGIGDLVTGPVAAVAEVSGSRGNVASATLTKFKGARPSGVDSVTNTSPFSSGQDIETDDSFRLRLQNYARSLARGTGFSLENAALSVSLDDGRRVVFAHSIRDAVVPGKVKLYIDDGAGTTETMAATGSPEVLTQGDEFPGDVAQGGEHYLYLNNWPVREESSLVVEKNGSPIVRDVDFTLDPTTGQIYLFDELEAGDDVTAEYTWFTGLIAETQKVIDGDRADRLNYPGYRAGGDLVIVAVPTITYIVISGDLTVRDGYNIDEVTQAAKDAAASYVNTLGIGRDVLVAEIIERVMGVDGVYNVSFFDPAGDIPIPEDTLPRVDALNITFT